jgi:hypothetical protein
MKMKSINGKRIYGVYDGKAYLLDGEPRHYPEAVKRAYADILIEAEPAPEAEEAIEPDNEESIEPDDNEYDGGY